MASAADRRLFWGVAGVVVALDLATKFVAEARLTYRPLAIVGDWIRLRLVYNEGAAFGLHLGEYSRWIFFALALLALTVLGSMVRTTRPISCRTLRSRCGVPSVPRKYFDATTLVAVCDQNFGTSTSFCSKTTAPFSLPMTALRSSHSTSSNGSTPGFVK